MAILSGLVNRIKPGITGDGNNAVFRQGRYGELLVYPVTQGTYPVSDEGSYFKTTNPTIGTGITAGITTAFSATAAFFNIRNTDTVGTAAKRIYLDYITLICNTVPASSTSMQLAITIDNPATARYSSGGTALTTACANMDLSTPSVANIHAGALVLTAASGSARTVARGVLRSAIPVLQDSIMIQFGEAANVIGTMGGTTAIATADDVGPIIIGPQQDLNVHIWWPGNATTAGIWELEAGWWER